MLRINENTSAAGAKSYYSTADYYTEGQELDGVWRGIGAEQLGLSGKVDQRDWDALCDNRHPESGDQLTLRRKGNRRVGYDFNFHVPKSVSLLYSLTRDERLLDAFRESVRETMSEMEAEMLTRVRKDGANEDRMTGNMVWGEFVHFTSRPIDGIPDPHLHAHCFVFNTTHDDQENAWKAGQFSRLKQDAPYFEARFHVRLSHRLKDLGLAITRTKSGWEVTGLHKSTLDKFSRRTALIEEEARRKGILDPAEKSELGAKTREKKQKELTLDELRIEWRSRLTEDETSDLRSLIHQVGSDPLVDEPEQAAIAVRDAISHTFERKSVVPERTLQAAAFKRSVGRASLDQAQRTIAEEPLIIRDHEGRRWATTPDVLHEERQMVAFARNGRGTQLRLGKGPHTFQRSWLNVDQKKAVEHLLNSPDRVILIRGAAGVGKTTMMQEAVEGIEASGQRVFVFAPSADASRGTLRAEGFENAETVARLMLDENLQREIQGQVIWIDEAGLLGTKAMGQLFHLAEKLEARVILSGDRRQHGSVERGAALRLLEEDAGLVPAEIREIQRQKGDYKQAIHALSEGRVEDGFRQLDRLGWIREVRQDERYQALAADFVSTIKAGKTALVVSPTHKEGDRITTEIRDRLKRLGHLSKDERPFLMMKSMNLTEAERSEAENYQPGDIIEFHQNAKGHTKGQRVVMDMSGTALVAGSSAGDPQSPQRASGGSPLEHAKRFQTYRPTELPLAPGDLIRITKNGQTLDQQHRLNNGSLHRVKRFDKSGNIVLDNNWTISNEFGHLTHGYVTTSHASQGKTVDRVFIGESAESFKAASQEQFYVSASRGREQVTIYTDNKSHLLDAIHKADDRMSASELVRGHSLAGLTPPARSYRYRQAAMRKPQLLSSHYVPMPQLNPNRPEINRE